MRKTGPIQAVWFMAILCMLTALIPALAPAQKAAPGAPFAFSAAAETTSTLVMKYGPGPGEYAVGESLKLNVKLLLPGGNRTQAVRFQQPSGVQNVLEGGGARVRVTRTDASTAVIDVDVPGNFQGLAVIELTDAQATTTTTLLNDGTGARLTDPKGPVFIQSTGSKSMRSVQKNGIRLVSSIRKGTAVRVILSTSQKDDAAIKALPVVSMPPPVAREVEVGMAPSADAPRNS